MLRNKIETIQARLEQEALDAKYPVQAKMRTAVIQHSVGQVFRHAKHGYRAVIYGWHDKCHKEAYHLLSSGEEETTLGSKQPFYASLIDTRDRPRQSSIVSQENIVLEPGDIIQHPDVGSYFTAFRSGNYIPNELLKQEYPDDPLSAVEVKPTPLLSVPGANKRHSGQLY